MVECVECGAKATHVLVNYRHEIVDENQTFCSEHAFDDGREECPCCYDYWIEVERDGQTVMLLPTYPYGTLDQEGCCSEHP